MISSPVALKKLRALFLAVMVATPTSMLLGLGSGLFHVCTTPAGNFSDCAGNSASGCSGQCLSALTLPPGTICGTCEVNLGWCTLLHTTKTVAGTAATGSCGLTGSYGSCGCTFPPSTAPTGPVTIRCTCR